jgi:small conductance mechanosensitive channel
MDGLVLQTLPQTVPGLDTTETRAAATVALLAVTAFVAGVVVPGAARRIRDRLMASRLETLVRSDAEYGVGLRLVHAVRVVQVVVVLSLATALLVVWGQTGWAVAVVTAVGLSLPALGQVGLTAAVAVGAVVALRYLESVTDSLAEEAGPLDRHQGEVIFRVSQVALIIAAGGAALTVWDLNPQGLLVGAGFLGIVVGMAARQTLGSMIAGFVMMFSRPFEVGDWVAIGDEEGIVTDITIVNTRMENFDGEYVVLPNDAVSNSTIVNRTRKGRLRVRLEVGVDYTVDPERAEAVASEALQSVDEILTVPRPQVVPTGFGDSAINLELRFWIDKPSARRRWRSRAAVLRAVYAAFEREGVKIPYPQRELSGRQEQGGFRVQERPAEATDPEHPADPAPDLSEED